MEEVALWELYLKFLKIFVARKFEGSDLWSRPFLFTTP